MTDDIQSEMQANSITIKNAPAGPAAIIARNLENTQRAILALYSKYEVPRESIDPTVRAFEESLQARNAARAKQYGVEYVAPKVQYLDHRRAEEMQAEIGGLVKSGQLQRSFDISRRLGTLQNLTNTVTIFTNNYDDPDVNAYQTASVLRHELDHAGSNRFFTAAQAGIDGPQPQIASSRTGAVVQTKQGMFGRALCEGHNSIHDQLAGSSLAPVLRSDEREHLVSAMNALDTDSLRLDTMYSAGAQKYRAIEQVAARQGLTTSETHVTGRHGDERGTITRLADSNRAFRELMTRIYSSEPTLFQKAEQCIYGNDIRAFADTLNARFGNTAFRALMHVQTNEQATVLQQELL